MKIDLTGQKFHRLQVVQKSEQQSKADAVLWDCICDCGSKTTATTAQLRSGHKKSCGCIKRASKAEDLTGLIPTHYALTASGIGYDPDKPCYYQTLMYNCDTTV